MDWNIGAISRTKEEARDLRRVAYLLGLVCLMIIIWPSSNPSDRYWSKTTWHVSQDEMVPVEQADREAKAIIAEAQKLYNENTLTVEKIVELQKRLVWLESHAEQYGPNPRPGILYPHQFRMGDFMRVRTEFLKQWDWKKDRLNSRAFSDYLDSDSEYKAASEFKASTTESNGWQVFGRYVMRYLFTLPIGFMLCVITMGLSEQKKLSFATVMMFNHLLRVALYPFGILVCLMSFGDRKDYRQTVRRLVAGLGYATAAAVSLFSGGVAMAQTVKKDNGKKRDKSYTLQLDTRVTNPTDGPPSLFNRTTLNGKGWVFDTISISTPATRSWYNETDFGRRIVKTTKTTVNLVGGMTNDSAGTRKLTAGVQYIRSLKNGVFVMPAIRVEKMLGGPWSLFAATNPLLKIRREGKASRLAFLPDVSCRWTEGKKASWTAGLGVGVMHRKGKADRVEVTGLKTSTGQWQIRGRYVVNFAF